MVGGRNDSEIIMVSSSDYDTLVATGAYEPVEETRPAAPAIPMKEVYGKQKSLYKKKSSHESMGSRSRVAVKVVEPLEPVEEMKEMEEMNPMEPIEPMESEVEKPDEESVFEEVLPEEKEIHQYLKKEEPAPMDGDEEGWSI